MQTSRARTERLWKGYLRDPSLWSDNRQSKTNPKAPDFKHKLTHESLSMHGSYNPSWVQDRLRQEGLHNAQHEDDDDEDEVKKSACSGCRILSLEAALPSLEPGVPSIEDFARILLKCKKERDRARALRLHAYLRDIGLEAHRSLGNYLIPLLVDVGCMCSAQQVFDRLVYRNEWSWNSLIIGYVKCGKPQHALTLYQNMQKNDFVHPCGHTFAAILKACAKLKDLVRGLDIHAEIARTELLKRNLIVGTSLVDMYAKCGSLAKAQQVFDMLPVRDVVSWNALITGYAEHGHGEEALECFKQMQFEGVIPDAVTFACGLKACGSIGAIGKGGEIHAEIQRQGLLERDLVVGNTLVDMYAKCGLLAKAQQVLDKLPFRDVVSWTALMTGYVQLGESENVFHLFDRMLAEGIKPNPITFLVVLSACSRTGLFNRSQTYFEAMSKDYGIVPTLEHHTCMVDLLGRAGQLDKAIEMIKKMPLCPNLVVWHIMLCACRNWGNVEFGKQAFERALHLDEKDAVAYVLMSQIYAGAELEQEAKKVKGMRV